MARVFGKKKPNLDELIHPQTDGREGARPAAARDLQDGPAVHEGSGRAVRAAGVALAGGARDLLGGAGIEEGGGEPDQGQGGRLDHPAPGDLPIDAAELPARAAGDESVCAGVRVRAQPGDHSQGELRLRAGGPGGREEPRPHFAGAPEFPARRRLLSLRLQSPGRLGPVVQIPGRRSIPTNRCSTARPIPCRPT